MRSRSSEASCLPYLLTVLFVAGCSYDLDQVPRPCGPGGSCGPGTACADGRCVAADGGADLDLTDLGRDQTLVDASSAEASPDLSLSDLPLLDLPLSDMPAPDLSPPDLPLREETA